jgi:farnesyl-diphosphate farnesyltransferase
MRLTHWQIEQFIESIFPSQDPQAIVRQQAGEPEPVDVEKTKEMEEAKWDVIYMIVAVCGTLFSRASWSVGSSLYLHGYH